MSTEQSHPDMQLGAALRAVLKRNQIAIPAAWEAEFLPEFEAMLTQIDIVRRAAPQHLEPAHVFQATPAVRKLHG